MQIPYFLDLEQVLRLHGSLIENYGGLAGVRDMGLLQSAIAAPQAAYEGQFLYNDIFEMAAAYLYHLVQNHAFLDGNKRIGAASAIVFLAINDIQIQNDEEGLVEITLGVAKGQIGKTEIAKFLRSNVIDPMP
ncbi:Death on curing protein [Anaerohalosphaera lusitana]|uniref:Death on curing protein n=1 Tax=Anaerohalosphaera lusitana TaxID=1936003 RepID=A0A1U9NK21_9BACT|nr:type II toxin-antitoxin system death-on-curing family toxin [Anaerohalosphaera lusitana]AQT67930.1 Death on curing protein [Anaerohalosphaera lusitana]